MLGDNRSIVIAALGDSGGCTLLGAIGTKHENAEDDLADEQQELSGQSHRVSVFPPDQLHCNNGRGLKNCGSMSYSCS